MGNYKIGDVGINNYCGDIICGGGNTGAIWKWG